MTLGSSALTAASNRPIRCVWMYCAANLLGACNVSAVAVRSASASRANHAV